MAKRLTAAPERSAPKIADGTLERGIAAAASRVKWQDGLTGAAAVAVLVLAYAAAVVILDRWLKLPPWARQIGFGGLLVAVAAVGYRFIVRPMQKAVNPRYVARRMEETLDGTKNELINWVDMRDREIPGSIRAAVDAKAAAGLADADVTTAFRPRALAWLGGTAMVLVGVLAVLFLVFKAGQFTSLLGRAFNPFGSGVIASRTIVELVEPDPADATLTDGEQLRLVVRIQGRKPSADGPDRVRLLTKQTADATQWDEIPFTPGSAPREYDLTVGRGVIQNGFWYKVAAGDGETAEHRISVRTRPLVTAFEAKYEYPAYTRMAPDIGREPRIEAHRGTVVTLTVKTNRTVKSGTITFDGKPVPVAGSVPAEATDSLRFTFKLDERTNYRVQFSSTDAEASGASPAYPVEVIPDRAPAVAIEKPESDEAAIPLGSLLAVDGTISDDFGIDTATLVVKVANPNGTVYEVRKPYLAGKSLKREKDGTFPTTLKYQDSLKLENLKTPAGVAVPLAADTVAEYWLEAADNCTEPAANVGRSAVKKVKLVPPPPPEKKGEQDKNAAKRQTDDQNQQQGEKNRRDNEQRNPPPQRPGRQPEKPADPKQGENGNEQNPNKAGQPENNPGAKPPEGEQKPPENNGQNGNQGSKNQGQPGDANNPSQKPEDLQRKAEELQRKIDEQNREGADSKPGPDAAAPNEPNGNEPKPAERKPSDGKTEAGAKSEPKPGDGAAENKESGKSPPPETSTEKSAPPKEEPNGGSKPEDQPHGDAKSEPRGGQTGGEQKPNRPEPGSPDQPKGGEEGGAKPASPKPEEGQPPEKDPTKGGSKTKPDGKQKPGEEKGPPQSGEGGPQPHDDGGAKGQKPPEASSRKGPPKEQPGNPDPTGEKAQPKEKPENDEAGTQKGPGDDSKTPTGSEPGQTKPTPKGTEKGSDTDKTRQPGDGDRKPDAKDVEKAVENLDSPDLKKQQEAKDTLDKAVGKQNREKAEQLKKDLQSGDPNKQAAAKKEIEDLKKQAGQGQQGEKGQEPTKEELEQFQKDAKDLNSPDDKTRKAAEQKLDKQIGKAEREKLQERIDQLENDAKSGDSAKKEAADRELQDLIRQNAEQANKNPNKREQREGDAEQLRRDAQDLASDNPQKRKEAEDKFDKEMGKKAREELQKNANDAQSPDKDKAQEGKDSLEKKVKDQAKKQADRKLNPGGDAGKGQEGEVLAEDRANRRKTAERQLENFKNIKNKEEFLRQNKMSEADFDRFLKGYEEMVAKEKAAEEADKLNPPSARPAGPATIGKNDGGGERVEVKPAAGVVEGPGGAGVAPPGFDEAGRGFVVPRRPGK